MKDKFKKYLRYLQRFANSPKKAVVLHDLFFEIKRKGVINGIQSLLHVKSGDAMHDENDAPYADPLIIKEYDGTVKCILPETSNPTVSIVIPMYNQMEFTHNCIRSIYENGNFDSYEIIIADDNSTEDSSSLLSNFKNLIIIKNPTNLGFLKNCNNAATKARGKYIVFLNNDVQVQPDWLSELVGTFDQFKNVGLVGSKLVYPGGQLQEAGGIIWQDGSGWNYGNMDHPGRPAYNYVKETDYISGASIMISAELWHQLGGFDERYAPAYYEDTDLCFQVREKGLKVMYQPASVAVHFEGISHGKDLNSGIKHYQVLNHEKFMKKWSDVLKTKSPNGENVFVERDRTNGKKHVLVIDHEIPTIDKDAGSRCISNFIDCLLDLDCSVTLMTSNRRPQKKYVRLFQEKGVEVLYGPEFSYDDYKWEYFLRKNMQYIDAVLMSRANICMPVLKYLIKNKYAGNTIYFGHDLGYLSMEQEAALTGNKLLLKIAKKVKGDEDFMYQNADNSLVLSYDEIDYLKKYITKPLHYIPPFFFDIVTDITDYNDRSGMLFVGGFNHPPNRDAMKWFLNDIYTDLAGRGIPLTIVGSKIPDWLLEYKQQFSTLTIIKNASVAELEDLYAKTRIAIVPLRIGAGVKGKVIEAMAKGVPIAGTDRAFEGISKDDFFLYKGNNTAMELKGEIIRLYEDKERWNSLSSFGVSYAGKHFTKNDMKKVFEMLLD